MITYAYNVFAFAKGLIPHFLQKVGQSLIWVTNEGLQWIVPGGLAWGTGSSSRHRDWIESLLQPLQEVNDDMSDFVDNTRYLMRLTGQVIYLEHYLNDLLDPIERRIYIEDGSIILPAYLYNAEDNEAPWYLHNTADGEDPFYVYNIQDFFETAWFTVFVPAAIPLTPDIIIIIRRAVNRYKQAGPTYTIENF